MHNLDLKRAVSLSLLWVSLGSFTTALIFTLGDNYLGLLIFQLIPISWSLVTRNGAITVFYCVGIGFALVGDLRGL